jgi:hypothetical protein
VIGYSESFPRRYVALAGFYGLIEELFDPSALLANDMIVVMTAVEFEYCLPPLEMVSFSQPGIDELGKDAIDGRKPDLFAALKQRFVYIFGGHVPRFGRFKDLEDLYPRQSDLQPCLANFFVLH